VNVTSEVDVSFGKAPFDLQEYIDALRVSGLPEDLAVQSARR
jgi:hypothetical protein